MKTIKFIINKWELNPAYYELCADGEKQLDKIPIGKLRKILYEIEKYMRLRFKGELKH